MSSINSKEVTIDLQNPQYRKVGAVYLGTQEECIFARNPNESPSVSRISLSGDCLAGERPTLEIDIKTKLMMMSNLRALAIVESPIRGGWKLELIDGWDGKSGVLVVSKKRVYRIFISSYPTGSGGSAGHFLIQEVSTDARLVGNILHAPELDNMLRLALWQKPATSLQAKSWGGSVEIEGANPGGLVTEVLGVINKAVGEKQIPVWRRNKI